MPCRLQSHSAGARHTLPLSWKNVLSKALGTDPASSHHPPSPRGCTPCTWAGKSRATLGSHSPSGSTGARWEGHAAHFQPPAQLPSHGLTLPRVSRTREVHKPHQSSPLSHCPPGYRSHPHQGISAEPARDQTRNVVEHQRCFSSTIFLPAGMPLLGPARGQGYFGEQVRSRERHLQACGQVTGQLCLLKQQVADLFPATSRGAQQEANMLPQECRWGQAAPASTLCMPHTLWREPECHFLDQASKGCLCHL